MTRLAKRYGIVTPYTSFLMTDDVIGKQQRELTDGFRGLQRNYFQAPSAGARPALTDEAARKLDVSAAKLSESLRRGGSQSGGLNSLEEAAEGSVQLSLGFGGAGLGDANGAVNSPAGETASRPSLAAIRSIGTRTFYHSGDVWYESEYDPAQTKIARSFKVGSDDYIQLLMDDVQLAKFFALGDVVLQIDGEWVRIES